MSDTTPSASRLGANKRKGRLIKDKAARIFVTIGGLSVIFAVLLIFGYLGRVVYPLFTSPEVVGEQPMLAVQAEDAGYTPENSAAMPYQVPANGKTVHLGSNEKGSIGVRITDTGEVVFFAAMETKGYLPAAETVEDFTIIPAGKVLKRMQLQIAAGSTIVAVAPLDENKGELALGLSNGDIIGIKPVFNTRFKEVSGSRKPIRFISTNIEQLFESFSVGAPPTNLSIVESDEIRYVAFSENGQVKLLEYEKEVNELDEDAPGVFELVGEVSLKPAVQPDHIFLDPKAKWVFVVGNDAKLAFYELQGSLQPTLLEGPVALVGEGETLSHLRFLNGSLSLLAATKTGKVSQWFAASDPIATEKCSAATDAAKRVCQAPSDATKCAAARDEKLSLCSSDRVWVFPKVREFQTASAAPITDIGIEFTRKGFVTADENGGLDLFYSTSGRHLLNIPGPKNGRAVTNVVMSRNAYSMIIESGTGTYETYHIHNEYPEVGWRALWGNVWYESYQGPDYVWQSTGSTDASESKFSLMPLSFGTLKAAFYAMLLALPLAICGALYTAYFMSASLRQVVKPVVEIMEALPTVIIGFLAGLWLAPFFEVNMLAVFLVLLSMPIGIMGFGFVWQALPGFIRHRVPDGWDAALLIPWIIFVAWACFMIATPLEYAMFTYDNVWDSGTRDIIKQSFSMTEWLSREIPRVTEGCTAGTSDKMATCGYTSGLGWGFDQRNSVVVGLAMGFAVIPTIFSIAEDAVFGVPKHLSQGSLALGATQWQTMVRVVLPTASPGIFSGVMIGLGRAVGETMIVLMATGNTAVMDLSPFSGLRTLSANIAVEMPEAEVGSTHYRILFLSGLVLFVFTFFFNTIAELVRQRLRKKYTAI